jgi:hypothetical protein
MSCHYVANCRLSARRAYWLYSRAGGDNRSFMPYRPHRHEPNYSGPEVVTSPSPAPPVVVEAWCIGVERMNRFTLDRFRRDIWKRFDYRDLEPLKWAIIRRRRILALQLRQ